MADRYRQPTLFAEQTVAAAQALVDDEEQTADSWEWVHFDRDELERERSGITVDANVIEPFANVAAKMVPTPRSVGDRIFVANTRDTHVGTAPMFGLVVVDDRMSIDSRLQGGRVWQRLHLAATTVGLAVQPLSQLTERADREQQLGLAPRFTDVLSRLHGGRGNVLMSFRIGYATRPPGPSPRRSVSTVTFPPTRNESVPAATTAASRRANPMLL